MDQQFFLARQSILDRNLKLFAYELLFRASNVNSAPGDMDSVSATAQVLIHAMEIGVDRLSRGRAVFINLPREFLVDPTLLPVDAERVVLEILEDVTPDDEVVAGVRVLRESGFKIALDDVVDSAGFDAMLPFVDVVKIDIRDMDADEWSVQIDRIKTYGCRVLAEKVETQEEFKRLKELGVDYFQGYFFARPRIISGKRLPTNKVALLHLLSKLNDPNTDVDELQLLISQDVMLSVRALAYANSAANALDRKIDSVKEAVVWLGRELIRKWVVLYLMSGVEGKADEILSMALVRAHVCELVARRSGFEGPDTYFTVGLLSILDALLDVTIVEVLEHLALPLELRDALVSHSGERGEVLQCALQLESGEMGSVSYRDLDESELGAIYLEALQSADAAADQAGLD